MLHQAIEKVQLARGRLHEIILGTREMTILEVGACRDLLTEALGETSTWDVMTVDEMAEEVEPDAKV